MTDEKDTDPAWWRRIRSAPTVASALFVATGIVAAGTWLQGAQATYDAVVSIMRKLRPEAFPAKYKYAYFLGRSVGGLQFEAHVGDPDPTYVKFEKAQVARYLDKMGVGLDAGLLPVEGGFLWSDGPPTGYVQLLRQEAGEGGERLFLVGYAVGHAARRARGFLASEGESEKAGRRWDAGSYSNAAHSLLDDVGDYLKYASDLDLPAFSAPQLKTVDDDKLSDRDLKDARDDLRHVLEAISGFDDRTEASLNRR